jgi:hypothetical protein
MNTMLRSFLTQIQLACQLRRACRIFMIVIDRFMIVQLWSIMHFQVQYFSQFDEQHVQFGNAMEISVQTMKRQCETAISVLNISHGYGPPRPPRPPRPWATGCLMILECFGWFHLRFILVSSPKDFVPGFLWPVGWGFGSHRFNLFSSPWRSTACSWHLYWHTDNMWQLAWSDRDGLLEVSQFQ